MNNPNPFVPKGSILEHQSKRRSRLKFAVFGVIAFSVAGLSLMLMQGCKREQPVESTDNTPTIDTNTVPAADTNTPAVNTNLPAMPPNPSNTPPPTVVAPPVVETAAGTEYIVAKGDTLAKIAKKNGVNLKTLEAANPGVVPTKLKIGQKLTIPAGTGGAAAATSADAVSANASGQVYVVKSGDTLTKIAKQNGTTVKAIQSANNFTTTKIKVGQKLAIPSKADASAPVVAAPAPVPPTPVAPVTPPSTTPAQ